MSCVSQGFVGHKRVNHQCWCMSFVCPLLAEACLSCLILQMGFWNSWVDADALTRDCLTLLLSLQTLSWLLGVFCVLIYWILYIFSKTIWVGTSNSLSPTSHIGENTSSLVTQQWSLSFITWWFFSRFICQSSCDGCSVYLIFYTKVEFFFLFFLKCDLTVAWKTLPVSSWPQHYSVLGARRWRNICLAWKQLLVGRALVLPRMGSADNKSVESGTLRNIRTSFQLEQT